MTDIDQQLSVFKKAMIEINNYQSFTKSITEKFITNEQLLDENNLITKRSEMSDYAYSDVINFVYKNYGTGKLESLETSKFTLSDFYRMEFELRNRQYQLLLLNAFEIFEQYLKSTKLFIIDKSKNKKSFSPSKFILNLHQTVPTISTLIRFRSEANPNFLSEINLLLTFSLVEQLRHQITHSRGYACDKALFIKRCLERVGRFNNGKPKLEYTNYLNSFFGSEQYENLICLTEIRDKQDPSRFYDRLGELIEELTSYIIFIHGHVKRLIKETHSAPEA